jgi:hypothetical protein
MKAFRLLHYHVPTTGFACLWEMFQLPIKQMYITGFDFMTSNIHNMDEKWNPGRQDDPVRHMHSVEADIVKEWARGNNKILLDKHLRKMFKL